MPPIRCAARFQEETDPVAATFELRREDALRAGGISAEDRSARDLGALLKIGTALSAIHGLAGLEAPLAELILEVVPAKRGAIIQAGDGPGGPVVTFAFDREVRHGPLGISGALVGRVLDEGIAILTPDTSGGSAPTANSALPVCSRLAVPMLAFGRVTGAIYLETDEARRPLDRGHLALALVVAGIAAMARAHAAEIERLAEENRRLAAEISVEHNMVGESAPMRLVYDRIARVAPTNATVLLTGESGSGKELVARAIHDNSPRGAQPFVAINCAALTETLLESELFGHEKGAFTGAFAQKKGKLEAANGGTVFFDEIAETPSSLQVKLLRALQEREFERVGGLRSVRIDVRVIAATNRDLEAAVRDGSFRRDLFYRLNVVSIDVPALRTRRNDVPLLATHFARKYAERCKRRVRGLTDEAVAYLCAYDWPGNVRELENAIERAVVLGSGDLICPEDLPEAVLERSRPAGLPGAPYHQAVQEAKRAAILAAFERANGSHAAAARLLAVHPNYLHRLLNNLDLRPDKIH